MVSRAGQAPHLGSIKFKLLDLKLSRLFRIWEMVKGGAFQATRPNVGRPRTGRLGAPSCYEPPTKLNVMVGGCDGAPVRHRRTPVEPGGGGRGEQDPAGPVRLRRRGSVKVCRE